MPLSAAERMSIGIQCPRCHQITQKFVPWLANNSQLRCGTPTCRAIIKLDAAQYRAIINELPNQASEFDVLMIELEPGY